MSQIFLDTNIFIYLLEDSTGRGEQVARLLQRIEERGDDLVTSTLTLGELLVKPRRNMDVDLEKKYEFAMLASDVKMVSFDRVAAGKYADIRRDTSIRSPDAIQLACAASARCDLFITNDESLTRRQVDGIQFIITLDRVPF